MNTQNTINAMAFYHSEGFVPAWKQAIQFAGSTGHIATLPELIDARLACIGEKDSSYIPYSEEVCAPWEMYFTTCSAEYVGLSKTGKRIIIVAHGVGPMATLDGILKAYSYQYKDKERNRRGGRISQEDFFKLENGDFGPVSIVDFDAVISRYQYPFMESMTASAALSEPLLEARLGPRWAEYLNVHAQVARDWHMNQSGFTIADLATLQISDWAEHQHEESYCHLSDSLANSDPYIFEMSDSSDCSYRYHPLDEGLAFASLLSMGRLIHINHAKARHGSLISDVSCHEWYNGVRLIAVQNESTLSGIHPGVGNVRDLMKRHWQYLMQPAENKARLGMRALTKVGTHWFTQRQKNGDCMDTHEPEYLVTSIEPVTGGPSQFRTPIGGGYHGLFRYGIKEVERIAPQGANAYLLPGDAAIDGSTHVSSIQFFHVEVDTSQRLPRRADVENNFQLLMDLIRMDSWVSSLA